MKAPFPSRWIENPLRNTTTPFVYKIEVGGRLYIGKKFQPGCHPEDLMVSYFTSSKPVWEQIQRGNLPTVLKVKPCGDEGHAGRLEQRYLRRFLPKHRGQYWNQVVPPHTRIPEPESEESILAWLEEERRKVEEEERAREAEAQRWLEEKRWKVKESERARKAECEALLRLLSPEARRATFKLVR